MRWWWRTAAAAALATAAASGVRAEPLFGSPPHFVDLPDRQQVVFFLNEPVTAAVAARVGETAVEVLVPRTDADPALLGKDFGALRWRADDGGVRHLVMNAAERRTQIRIETGRPVVAVDARGADDPPRLVIDLVATAPTPTATPRRATRTPRAAVTPAPRGSAAPPQADGGSAVALGDLTATVAVAAPAAPAIGDLLAHEAAAAASPAPAAASAAAAPRPAPAAAPDTAGTPPNSEPSREPGLGAAAVGPPAPDGPEVHGPPVPDAGLEGAPMAAHPCRWTRVHGVACCAPDPTLPPYAAEALLPAVLALVRGTPAAAPTPGRDASAASLYLAADAALARGAATGRLLNAVAAYERALRQAPSFVDAPRARLNRALALRAMRLETELALAADAAADDPEGGAARALVGDLAHELGKSAAARRAYETAAAADPTGACLAARGQAALAVDAGILDEVGRALAAVAARCPAVLQDDAETALVRARAEVLAGDPRAAVTRLEALRGQLGVLGESTVLVELAAAREASGEPDVAARLYERVVRERRGEPAARRAAVRLAFLEGTAQGVHAGIRRLDRHLAGGAPAPRRALWMQALRDALARGAAVEAAALVHEGQLDDGPLTVEERLLVAAAYAGVGLTRPVEDLLRPILGPEAPAEAWERVGAALLRERRWADALALADAWAPGSGAAGAAALRARARAGMGDVPGALAALGGAAPDVRAEVVLALAGRDLPAAAPALAALLAPDAPALPPALRARALRAHGEAAEARGDLAAAAAAFTELAVAHAEHPAAADAAYRAARLAGGPGWAEAEARGDPLARRVAAALRASDAMLRTLGAPVEAAGAQP